MTIDWKRLLCSLFQSDWRSLDNQKVRKDSTERGNTWPTFLVWSVSASLSCAKFSRIAGLLDKTSHYSNSLVYSIQSKT